MKILGFDITRAKSEDAAFGDFLHKFKNAQRGLPHLLGGSFIPYSRNLDTYIREGYMANAHLGPMVNWILQKCSMVPFTAYKIKDDSAAKRYKALTGKGATAESYQQATKFRIKAFEELPWDNATNKRLHNPNEAQRWEEFLMDAIGFDILAGEQIFQRLDNGLDGLPVEVYTLPPQLVNVKASDKFRMPAAYYWISDQKEIPLKNIVHIKAWNPHYEGQEMGLRGLSGLSSQLLTLQGSNEALTALVKQYSNGGPPVVVMPGKGESGGMADLGDSQIESLKEQFQKYAARRQKGQIMVVNSPLDKLVLGLSPVDLAINESELFSRQNFANAVHVDSLLFGNTQGRSGTAAEFADARKRSFMDGCLPRLTRTRTAVNLLLNTEERREFIDFDATVLPEMNDDEEKKATALKLQTSFVTNAEKRAFMGWDADTRPEYQEYLNDYLIETGVTPYLMLQESALLPDEGDSADQTDIPD